MSWMLSTDSGLARADRSPVSFPRAKAIDDAAHDLARPEPPDILGYSEAFSSCDGKCISMKFKVLLEDAEEGGYIVSCPALPGCHSQGDTIEGALDNIKEAIVGCLESLNEERAKAFGSQAKVVEVTV